jgi:chlorite dismutase
MAWATIPHSYLAITKESEYSEEERLEVHSSGRRYLFVYPFWKKREWYRLPAEERKRIMYEHIEVGRRYPTVSINTTYSFGLDDQEFVVAFETDEPGDFLDLVQELRTTESSAYTLKDTPIFTCISSSTRRALDALDGEATAPWSSLEPVDAGSRSPS